MHTHRTKIRSLHIFVTNILTLLQNGSLDYEENILGGDLNCSLDPALNKKGGILTPRKAVISCIGCLQNKLDLIDKLYGELRTLELRALHGVNNVEKSSVILIIG